MKKLLGLLLGLCVVCLYSGQSMANEAVGGNEALGKQWHKGDHQALQQEHQARKQRMEAYHQQMQELRQELEQEMGKVKHIRERMKALHEKMQEMMEGWKAGEGKGHGGGQKMGAGRE